MRVSTACRTTRGWAWSTIPATPRRWRAVPHKEGDVMSDMRLVVVGAAGRMGQTLIRTIHTSEGVTVAGAIERAGSPHVGKDAGEMAGVGVIGVPITDDPLPAF